MPPHQVSDRTLEILELPVRKWTQDYKEFLEGLTRPEEKDVVGGGMLHACMVWLPAVRPPVELMQTPGHLLPGIAICLAVL